MTTKENRNLQCWKKHSPVLTLLKLCFLNVIMTTRLRIRKKIGIYKKAFVRAYPVEAVLVGLARVEAPLAEVKVVTRLTLEPWAN